MLNEILFLYVRFNYNWKNEHLQVEAVYVQFDNSAVFKKKK
jgi:hypothetical protein